MNLKSVFFLSIPKVIHLPEASSNRKKQRSFPPTNNQQQTNGTQQKKESEKEFKKEKHIDIFLWYIEPVTWANPTKTKTLEKN